MKIRSLWMIGAGCLLLAGTVLGQAPAPATDPKEERPAAGASAESAEQLEANFRAALTKAELKGRWYSVRDGVIGPEREEQYNILGVTKLAGDMWLIQARIRYAQKDITAPIPVRVKWAGDTPVITVDNVPVPGSGTYSARVMIFKDTYAGTWTGGDHGGLLSGVIRREPISPAPSDAETQPKTP